MLCDLLPSYRIRLPSAEEQKAKVGGQRRGSACPPTASSADSRPVPRSVSACQLSEETRRLWRYEALLLRLYSRLVAALRGVVAQAVAVGRQRRVGRPDDRGLTAVSALARCLVKGFHFNCRTGRGHTGAQRICASTHADQPLPSAVLPLTAVCAAASSAELVGCLAPLLNHPLQAIRTLVWRALLQLFSADRLGEATAEVVQLLGRIVRKKCQPVSSAAAPVPAAADDRLALALRPLPGRSQSALRLLCAARQCCPCTRRC